MSSSLGSTQLNAEDDSPELRLLDDPEADAGVEICRQSLPPLLAAAACGGGPAWRLKRLRPVHISVGLLACFAFCLAVCSPLVSDLVREVSPPQTASSTSKRRHQLSLPFNAVTRLLSLGGHCVLATPSSSNNSSGGGVGELRCVSSLPECDDLPALCRYRSGMLACQVATPVCLAVCLGLLTMAVFAARRFAVQRRLLFAAFAFTCVGLVATVAFVACLHVLVGELIGASNTRMTYSADSAGARLAYAAICLQAVLTCQLLCLPACLARVGAERADLLAKLLG